jgi:hypothetical protein
LQMSQVFPFRASMIKSASLFKDSKRGRFTQPICFVAKLKALQDQHISHGGREKCRLDVYLDGSISPPCPLRLCGNPSFRDLRLLQLAPGIVSCSCQLHREIKETFRLAIEKAVDRKGPDGGYRTP